MNTSQSLRPILAAALAATCIAVTANGAIARQDAGPAGPRYSELNNPLERVGTQLVRGDNLTGNGASAASWIPRA